MTQKMVTPVSQTVEMANGGKANVIDVSQAKFHGEGWNKLSRDEWLAKGKALFGEDFEAWKFVCPSCAHVQTVLDFKQFKDQGASPDTAAQCCIGRYTGATGAFNPKKHMPCNYTVNGLFVLAKTVVVFETGKEQPVFEFALLDAMVPRATKDV